MRTVLRMAIPVNDDDRRRRDLFQELLRQVDSRRRMDRMTDAEIADLLLVLWEDQPIDSVTGELLSCAIDRLRRSHGGIFIDKESA